METRKPCGCITVTNFGWNSCEPVTRTILCEYHANQAAATKKQ